MNPSPADPSPQVVPAQTLPEYRPEAGPSPGRQSASAGNLPPGGYRAVHPPRSGSRLLGCLAFLLLLAAGLAIVSLLLFAGLAGSPSLFETDDGIQEKHVALTEGGADKIAIIRVEGAIIDEDGFVKKQIDRVRKDNRVKAIVLRVDSPGGTVSASDYLYHHLKLLREEKGLPIAVSMGGICASGGYYVSMAVGHTENAVFAEPTTWTGSIGVIIPHYNVAGLMQKWEIEEDSIKSHRLKSLGSPTKRLSEEERVILQGLVDDSFNRFKEIVRSGRTRFAEHPEQLDAVATGQVFTANQAVENGLVDRVGFVEDAVARVLQLAALDPDRTEVVKYNRQAGLFDTMLFGTQGRAGGAGMDLSRLLDLTTPRAYYMWSWLPQAEGIGRPR